MITTTTKMSLEQKQQEQIYSDNLSNLKLYPLWSLKRHQYIIKYREYKNDFITPVCVLINNLWRIRSCVCMCGFITTNQNLQKLKRSRKHLLKLANKEPMLPNDKITCECGGKYTQKNKLQHFKTKKHLLFLKD